MSDTTQRPRIKKLELEQFDAGGDSRKQIDLKQLNDVYLDMRAELGRARVSIRDILSWKKETIVTLNKLAGENVDIFVHGVRFASGEVLVVEDNFAVRLTELLSYIERVKLGLRASE